MRKRSSVDGLKGIFLILVILRSCKLAFVNADICVDAFFTIAGFLATCSMVKALNDKIKYTKFIVEYSAAGFFSYFVCLSFVAIGYFCLHPWNFSLYSATFVSSCMGLTNWSMLSDYTAPNLVESPVSHMFLLSIESQLFILCSIFSYIFYHNVTSSTEYLQWVFIAVMCNAINLTEKLASPEDMELNTFYRGLCPFCIGCITSLVLMRTSSTGRNNCFKVIYAYANEWVLISFGIIVTLATRKLDHVISNFIHRVIVSLNVASVLYITGECRNRKEDFFLLSAISHPILGFFGSHWKYIYIIHWPLIVIEPHSFIVTTPLVKFSLVLLIGCIFGFCIKLGIEDQIQSMLQKLQPSARQCIRIVVLGVVFVAIITLFMIILLSVSFKFHEYYSRVANEGFEEERQENKVDYGNNPPVVIQPTEAKPHISIQIPLSDILLDKANLPLPTLERRAQILSDWRKCRILLLLNTPYSGVPEIASLFSNVQNVPPEPRISLIERTVTILDNFMKNRTAERQIVLMLDVPFRDLALAGFYFAKDTCLASVVRDPKEVLQLVFENIAQTRNLDITFNRKNIQTHVLPSLEELSDLFAITLISYSNVEMLLDSLNSHFNSEFRMKDANLTATSTKGTLDWEKAVQEYYPMDKKLFDAISRVGHLGRFIKLSYFANEETISEILREYEPQMIEGGIKEALRNYVQIR